MIRIRMLSTMLMATPALLIGGCTANDPGLGDALKSNIALQVIDPDPAPRGDAIAGGSGDLAARAAENYRKGTVKQPVSVQTSTLAGAGTSGGSGPK